MKDEALDKLRDFPAMLKDSSFFNDYCNFLGYFPFLRAETRVPASRRQFSSIGYFLDKAPGHLQALLLTAVP
jgi:hypothetical protein